MDPAGLTSLLKGGSYLAGGVSIAVALILTFYVVARSRRRGLHSPARARQTDLASMMILLQTMRDLLEQQKGLARQINENIDRKIAHIRETVDAALKEAERIRAIVEETAQRARGIANPHGVEHAAESGRRHSELHAPSSGMGQVSRPIEKEAEGSQIEIIAQPVQPGAEESILDNWIGLELAEEEGDPARFDVPEQAPEAPDDAAAAREAFRALLSMEEVHPAIPAGVGAPDREGGNGRRRSTPLQARVCEYRDAGMSVTQIARELGIGKGEVRLILSLRRNRS